MIQGANMFWAVYDFSEYMFWYLQKNATSVLSVNPVTLHKFLGKN